MKSRILLVLFFLISVISYSQTIKDNRFAANYTYIFRLDSSQARQAIQRIRPDSAYYLTHKVDSFLMNGSYEYSKLPWGFYYVVSVNQSIVSYKTIHNEPFKKEFWGLNERNFITLKDAGNHIIQGARLTLQDGTDCPFMPGIGAYELPVQKQAVLVKMCYMDQWDYQYLNPQYAKAPDAKPQYPNYRHTTIAPGYLVFNQPKFKFHDTLKFKAFLLNDNGTVYKQKLKLYLGVDGNDKFVGYYKPRTPGAYFGQFEISDTMGLDKTYTLSFRNLNNEIVKSNTFYIENYELKPVKYNLQGPKRTCLVGDKVEFVVMTVDANNLPIMDATISLDLRLKESDNYLTDRFFIPDEWRYRSYYHIEMNADVTGYTSIVLPDSLFHHFDGTYDVFVHIREPNNNNVDLNSVFRYENKLYNYQIEYEGDSLKVRSFYKAAIQKKELKLETIYPDKTVKKTISTPYSEPLDFYATGYRIYHGDSFLSMRAGIDNNYIQQVTFEGNRAADSVHIHLVNPIGLPVYYEVYRGSVKVSAGNGTKMDFHAADVTQASYHVVWGYNLLGLLMNSFRVQSFHLYETRLNVQVRQPQNVYPGQKVDIAVKVTDQFNKGVPGVNLTAYAVNSQFPNIPLPDVPYMGLSRGGYSLQKIQLYSYLPDLNYSGTLKKHHFNVLRLFDNEVYKLLYGKGGKSVATMPISRKKPELAAYVYHKHALQNIVYIKVDDQLVYHQYFMPPETFSFAISAGTHKVSIRTFDRLLYYNNLQVKDSNKYLLAFNLDSLTYSADTSLYLSGKLKAYEQNEFLDHTLFLHLKNPADSFSVIQDRQLKLYSDDNPYANSMLLRIEKDNYLALGPLRQGSVTIRSGRRFEHDLTFSRGHAYMVFEDEIKEVPVKDELRQYGLLSGNVMHGGIYNLYSFNVLMRAPEYDTLPRQQVADSYEENAAEKTIRERPFVEQKVYEPEDAGNRPRGTLLLYVNPFQELFTNVWLIDKKNHKLSVINYQYRDKIPYYDSASYDLLLFTDTSVAIYRDLPLATSGTYVLFVNKPVFKPLTLSGIYAYDEIVAELTKEPFREFVDTPLRIRPVEMARKAYKSAFGKLSGTVSDARYNTPIDFSDLYMEIEGYFKAGASTNSEGRFMIEKLPPGNYMLKIRSAEYRFHVIYNLKIEKSKELVLNIQLVHREDDVYYNAKGEVWIEKYKGQVREATPEYLNAMPTENGNVEYDLLEKKIYHSETNMSYSAIGSRGARNDMNAAYIDGVRMSNSEYLTSMPGVSYNGELYVSREYAQLQGDDMQARLQAMALVGQANRIRDKFRDYAYWVPNLLTDGNGMAYFTVTFPDNITSWQTMVPAMNGKRQSGMSVSMTRAFKPLTASMEAPFFVTEGDHIILKGRIMNYTGQPQQVSRRFMLDDRIKKGGSLSVTHFMLDTLIVEVPAGTDSIKAGYAMDMANGYADGEARYMPVRPNGIVVSESRQLILKNDTTFKVIIPLNVKSAKILVHNNEVERLMNEIENLKNYNYGCVEQTASKLRALLSEKAISEALGLEFKDDKLVRKMINKLNTMKNNEGTWTWWGGEYGEEDWLSSYVMRTLNQARMAGYSNNVYTRAAKRLENKLPRMAPEARLYALNVLWDMDRQVVYDSFVKDIHPETLTDNGKLLWVRLKQKTGKKYQVSEVTQLLKYGDQGGIYFGQHTMRYHDDISSTSLIAYDILSHNDSGKEYLQYIRDFMYSSAYPRHTFAMAEMIALGSGEVLKNKKSGINIVGEMAVNGYILQTADYPFKKRLMPGDTVHIAHKGPVAYASIITSRLETNPQPDNTYFSIRTALAGQKDQVYIQSGQPVEFLVDVDVYKSAEHVMLEIPLPAGFSYFEKPAASGIETYREYFYDKTSIFCRNLPTGHYTFRIMVAPKFSGKFNLPPAKIELMYYPEIHNNEKTRVVEVK